MALIASLMKQASKAWGLKLDRGGWRSEMIDCGQQHLWTPSRALTWGKEKHGTVLGWIKARNADLCCVGETRGWEGRTSREGWSRAHGVKAGETNSGLGEAWVKPPSVDKKTLMLWKWWEPRENRDGRSHWLGGTPEPMSLRSDRITGWKLHHWVG